MEYASGTAASAAAVVESGLHRIAAFAGKLRVEG